MANFVAPGHLKIKDEEKLDLHPEKGVLNIKSKNFKKGGNKSGSGIAGGKAPKVLIKNKTPLQPEGLSMEEIFPEDFDVDEQHHDHSKCMSKIDRIHIAQLKVQTALQLHDVLPKEEFDFARMKRLLREEEDKGICNYDVDDYSSMCRIFISSP